MSVYALDNVRTGRDNGSCLYTLSIMLELVETTGHVCIRSR